MKDALNDIRSRLLAAEYCNEEQVRLSLVSRVLQELGWDIWNPMEVRTEFPAVPEEDRGRVDVALFLNPLTPTVFIEVKAVGKLNSDLPKTERQLRDYNRNNTALFSIITDGRQWRFYYSQTGGEFSKKCFKVLDLVDDDLDDVEMFLSVFLSKEEVESGGAERDAEYYLQLNQKQRVVEDALPKARRIVQEPPFPSLPQALKQLVSNSGISITLEEAHTFITDAKPESLPADIPLSAPLPVSKDDSRRRILEPSKDKSSEPDYVVVYRDMLKSPDTLPSRMLRYIYDVKVITWADLKKACVRELGCKSESSGSNGASLKVLELDSYVVIDGYGPRKRIRPVQKGNH